MGEFFLGTSGWSYDDWVGPVYSSTSQKKLRFYTRYMATAEINSTFYAQPKRGLVWGWAKSTPEDFVFTAKLPKTITHEKILDVEEGVKWDLQSFLDAMKPLTASGKLGCLLIQLPPSFDYSPDTLSAFFDLLPERPRFAVEFRHLSWMQEETFDLLREAGVAYTIVDEPLLPPDVHVTAGHAYIRWHGHGSNPWFNYRYDEGELESWVPKVQEVKEDADVTFAYFNNHFHGYAVENGLQLMELLGDTDEKRKKLKAKVQASIEGPSQGKLDAFTETSSMDRLLSSLMPGRRLQRARDMDDSKVAIRKESEEEIEAKVKEYRVLIRPKEREILHDCADWSKLKDEGKMCKHLGKVLLTLGESAEDILRDLVETRDEWKFARLEDYA